MAKQPEFKATWKTGEVFVTVRLSGAPTLQQVLEFYERMAKQSKSWPKRVLVDMRDVTSLNSFTDQFSMGEAGARLFAHLERVASLVPAGRITRNSERPAQRKGLNLVVFDSEEDAIRWLIAQ